MRACRADWLCLSARLSDSELSHVFAGPTNYRGETCWLDALLALLLTIEPLRCDPPKPSLSETLPLTHVLAQPVRRE